MSTLGQRMKEYEGNVNFTLTNFLPIIIRIDGKKFSTYTRGMNKPFDEILMETMWETSKYLCENIQNAKIAYTQSDEISILVFQPRIESQAIFNNRIQKIVSIASSMATLAFNTNFRKIVENTTLTFDKRAFYISKYDKAIFDARVFTLPEFEVNNYFVWRQRDTEKNSKAVICQSLYSQKQLMNKNGNDQMELMYAKGINWNNIETPKKRGVCVIRKQVEINETVRNKWIIDKDIPIFSIDKNYINELMVREFN